MKNLAFLTMNSLKDFVSDDALAIPFLNERNWVVENIPWQAPTDWNQFDLVIVRSPWDYQDYTEQFVAVLETIEKSRANLQNPIDLMKWNIEKTYLRKLEKKGHRIIPTIWGKGNLKIDDLKNHFSEFATDEIIIKPTISANSDNTFRLSLQNLDQHKIALVQVFANRSFMVQSFMKNIVDEGEYSLFYFGGKYSHTILKTPKTQDFRVQEEHGGIITSVKLTAQDKTTDLLTQSQAVLQSLPQPPLYARVDWVRDAQNNFALMEVELIEPALYFRMDPPSASRFADAIEAL